MTTLGLIIMIVSIGIMSGLFGWTIYKVLTLPDLNEGTDTEADGDAPDSKV